MEAQKIDRRDKIKYEISTNIPKYLKVFKSVAKIMRKSLKIL